MSRPTFPTTTARGMEWWKDYQRRHPAMAEVRLSADWGDAWGATLGAHFAVCEVLSAMGEEIPAAWQYQRGPVAAQTIDEMCDDDDQPYEDRMLAEMVRDGQTDAGDLRYAGEVLHRYAGILRANGKDY